MSLKSDTTALGRKPKKDWSKPVTPWEWVQPPLPLPDWMKQPISVRPPMSKEYNDMVLRECYKGAEDIYNQSPYDAKPPPLVPILFGGSPTVPLEITDQNRSLLEELSQLALEYYNNKEDKCSSSSASFQFHGLVKCTKWTDARRLAIFTADRRPDPTEYYLTFQATAKGDTTSSSPAITTFQAKVLLDVDQIKPPLVEECRIHTPLTPPCESCP